MTEGVSIRALDWDSAFFGFPVAVLDPGAMALDQAVAARRDGGFRLAYLQVDTADLRLDLAARDCGGHMVDRRVELEADILVGFGSAPTGCEELSRDPSIADRRALRAACRRRHSVPSRMPNWAG